MSNSLWDAVFSQIELISYWNKIPTPIISFPVSKSVPFSLRFSHGYVWIFSFPPFPAAHLPDVSNSVIYKRLYPPIVFLPPPRLTARSPNPSTLHLCLLSMLCSFLPPALCGGLSLLLPWPARGWSSFWCPSPTSIALCSVLFMLPSFIPGFVLFNDLILVFPKVM